MIELHRVTGVPPAKGGALVVNVVRISSFASDGRRTRLSLDDDSTLLVWESYAAVKKLLGLTPAKA